jgi:hypothetical protein
VTPSEPANADADRATRELYERLIEAWNKRNARDYALLFASNGSIVGFDGSQVNGQLEIGAHVSEVFSHHQTASYVTIVREVRPIGGDVTLLVASRKGGKWEIALFQNTPAAFHGRPELSKKLTEELRAALSRRPARD